MGKAGTYLTEYERLRNARIEHNKKILQEFGVHDIANSLASVVQNKKSNKRKEKAIAHITNETDREYVPDFGGESDEENETYILEGFKKVKQSGGNQNVRFIPPRTMNKYSNFSRQGLR
ncbi:hypothetical protein RND81_08G078800 [Saponaria officinalis]|uniref:Uncharacterized protein n=1 Tax=Saponaria officinalis TaxID=3572 RepID=A0AAW1J4T5_SAPOF